MTLLTKFWTDVEKYLTATDLDYFHLLAQVYTNELITGERGCEGRAGRRNCHDVFQTDWRGKHLKPQGRTGVPVIYLADRLVLTGAVLRPEVNPHCLPQIFSCKRRVLLKSRDSRAQY